jgi:Outer membrane lipoprotein LolB
MFLMTVNVNIYLRQMALVLPILLFSGCAAAPKPPLTGLIPGKEMETLQSAVSISVTTAGGSFGGRGFLIFRRPDRFHLAVLSPFGSPLVEVYSDGDRFICLIPSRQTAYSGRIDELPVRDGLKAWSLMRWVVERTPAAGPARTRMNVNGAGGRELLTFDSRGLLEQKETEDGDRVVYRDYQVRDGIPFPESIELTDRRGDNVKISMEEPELNRPVAETALVPTLDGLKILPFSEFRGF